MLNHLHAVICGASQGIGRAIAQKFDEAGARLTLIARREESLNEVLQGLSQDRGHKAFACDLGDTDQLRARLSSWSDPVDILVNNAGGPPAGLLCEASTEALSDAFRVHVLASQLLMHKFYPYMKQKNYGRILNVMSTSVKVPIPHLGVSNTIRGAMNSWSKTLSQELGPYGITVNNLLPGYTSTERLEALKKANAEKKSCSVEAIEKKWIESIPARRFGEPHELAEAALFLASPKASYINGVSLAVDGGRTVAL